MKTTKSYFIPKQIVMEAFRLVKSNKGNGGVDNQSIEEFEEDLKNNLYKLWNRMSSGSYFPEAVKVVEIPKIDGTNRQLGIPTVTDRIAQMVGKLFLEPKLEMIFHQDSYGYRPLRTAKQAIGVARKRSWRNDWVIDLDIKGFFDNIDHALLMKAVRRHTDKKWILLYIERWLKAPAIHYNGTVEQRTKGTPQGGVISPLLANLYLHYAFDYWMARNYPRVSFIRYADDILIHCKSKKQAEFIKDLVRKRLLECNLEVHPIKTKIVYCKDSYRKGQEANEKFKFLGYEFRPRLVKSKNDKYFTSFTPAVHNDAKKHFKDKVRKFKLHKGRPMEIEEIAKLLNPTIYGWINYFWEFRKSETYSTLKYVDFLLIKWIRKRYKKLRNKKKAIAWLKSVCVRKPDLFAHWRNGQRPIAIG